MTPDPAAGRRGNRARTLTLLLVAVLVFYFLLIGARGVSLVTDPRWIVKLLGVGVLLLPLVGAAIVVAELRFGRATERLALQLGADPGPPGAAFDPDDAFALRRRQVEQDPADWQRWYRLALAYGAAHDSARGRRTMRRAVAMERAANPASVQGPPVG